MDEKWWAVYLPEVESSFPGERFSVIHRRAYGAKRADCQHFSNSGAGAISLAVARGAKRVVMLGYDCQRTGGKSHWHGDHGHKLGNAGSMPRWPQLFGRLAALCKSRGVPVVNATRQTALTCFPRVPLEVALADSPRG